MSGRTAGVIGLGLMGGSLARDLSARGWRVLGTDRDPDSLARSIAAGIVHGRLDLHRIAPDDVIVLALPVSATPAVLRQLAPEAAGAALIMDLGSTRRSMDRVAAELGLTNFVGAHPLAGDHRSGWDAGRCGLFRGARVYLCPAPGVNAGTLALADTFWRELHAVPVCLSPDEHDRRLARTSHLPQIVASALATVLAREGVDHADLGPGARDMLRLAGSAPALWRDIVSDNRDQILPLLESMRAALGELERALATGDAAVESFFRQGRAWHDSPASTAGRASESVQ